MREINLLYSLRNPDEFKRLFPDRLKLHKAAELFPQHAGALINFVLQNSDEFKRLFPNSEALYKTAGLFPQHADALINTILKNPNEFKRLFPNGEELCYTAELFPQHANVLINVVLRKPNQFRLLFPNKANLDRAAAFPEYADIFNKPNVIEALKAAWIYIRKSTEEIEKNINLLVQATRTKTGPAFFKEIPFELQAKIAGFTGNSTVHNEEESYAIAYNYFANK